MFNTANRLRLKVIVLWKYWKLNGIKERSAKAIRKGGIIMQDIADMEAKLRILERKF